MISSRSLIRLVLPSVAAAILAPAPAAAQVGVQAGVNLATLSQDPDFTVDVTRRTGITGGLFAILGPDVVTGQIEVLYSEKGARLATSPATEAKLSYLEVPVAIRVQMARGPRRHVAIFAGTAIALRLQAKQIVSGTETDIKEEIDELDFGITVGVGFEAGRVMGSVRYTHGLRDIDTGGTDKLFNRALTAMVGVSLN
jgi:hypothetical protein